ncbi:hypothetical protein Calkr_0684 [Caldicellulosiruptor acetigenus I77R1B]|uniref:Uncharacterized protein n=2 Tax=Caldicellulosiruptor acetigenus TaxID=301953 RepID=G2PT96_9FIRM|nr:hypothetical protein Calkr_0684 [Caldicellulosiruptor acetigenus I77R1B]AEM74255.1 hypothetical protein Calla_1659 [Caldicellulosiruptor acetigenus 6A]
MGGVWFFTAFVWLIEIIVTLLKRKKKDLESLVYIAGFLLFLTVGVVSLFHVSRSVVNKVAVFYFWCLYSMLLFILLCCLQKGNKELNRIFGF